MDDIFFESLRANKLVLGVPEEVLREASQEWTVAAAEAGTVLFDEGDPGDVLYIVLEGTVSITKTGRGGAQERLDFIRAGDFFGEMAVVDREPRSARAEAVAEGVLILLNSEQLESLMRAAPEAVGFNLVRNSVSRLRWANVHFIEEMVRAERLSTIGSMASGIIHDFKSPMTAILGSCELLALQHPEPEVLRMTSIIERATRRMVNMTQDLLDFSRGQIVFNIRPAPFEDWIKGVEEQILQPVERDGYVIERSIDVEGEVMLDFDRMDRVLANLVKNSCEATPRKGKISIGMSREGETLLIGVADTGRGMPPELVEKVFEPFVTSGKANGTGLGMALVKGVVDGHGGTIEVESVSGEGTAIIIRIPQSRREE
jgi:signal transduction histidine kinase